MSSEQPPKGQQGPADEWATALAQADEAGDGAANTTAAGSAAGASSMAMRSDPPAPVASRHAFDELAASEGAPIGDIERIMDIPVQLAVEIGRTRISIKNILQLSQGSVIELDSLAGEPMDVLINGTLIAQGEVVVVNEKFGIRLTDIITPQERIRKLNR